MRQERICFTRGGILCPRGMLLLFWLLLLYAACFSRANEENRDSGDGTAVRKKDFPTSIQGVLKLQEIQKRQIELYNKRALRQVARNVLLGVRDQAENVEATKEEGWTVICDDQIYNSNHAYGNVKMCSPIGGEPCHRFIKDKFVTAEEAQTVVVATKRAMKNLFHRAGATSLVPDESARERLGNEPWALINSIKRRVKSFVEEQYEIGPLYDSGSMLTRLTTEFERNDEWEMDPNYIYSNPHVDKANIASYDYSALLYFNSGEGVDFSGGDFTFMDPDADNVITPLSGRLVTFTSGFENPHRVEIVQHGTRLTLAMWFTCSKQHAYSVEKSNGDEADLGEEPSNVKRKSMTADALTLQHGALVDLQAMVVQNQDDIRSLRAEVRSLREELNLQGNAEL